MYLVPLPFEIVHLLDRLGSPPRLTAHLTLVHDVACMLTLKIDEIWPKLDYNREMVHLGAAIHDIGKILHPTELSGPGHLHEVAGEMILNAQGFPHRLAHIACSHGQWANESDIGMEDLFVALADTWWRGKRDEALETAVTQQIIQQIHDEQWQVFSHLDTIAADIAEKADARLAWQSGQPINSQG